jgi:hypothetical protein
MGTKAPVHSRQPFYRLVFLLLLTIPFLAEIAVWITASIAEVAGCRPGQTNPCMVGSLPLASLFGSALLARAGLIIAAVGSSDIWLLGFYIAIAGWLMACYIVLVRGWTRTPSRIALGFGLALVYAFVPYFGPMLAITKLTNEHCRPNEGGIGACVSFGSYVGDASYSPVHDAVLLGWLLPVGALLSLGTFVLYVVVILVMARRPRKA